MALLSKKDTNLILDPLADNNPITIQVLGICSALGYHGRVKGFDCNGPIGTVRTWVRECGHLLDA